MVRLRNTDRLKGAISSVIEEENLALSFFQIPIILIKIRQDHHLYTETSFRQHVQQRHFNDSNFQQIHFTLQTFQ